MGLKISTDDKGVKIYRKDRDTKNGGKFATYCMGVSSKTMDGTWVNGFVDCLFKKGVEVNHKAVIKINNAFPTVNEYNGNKYVKWFILDFEVIEDGEKPVEPPKDEDFMTVPEFADGELHFV